MSKPAVRLYRFYNIEHSKYGEPFALCDKHAEETKRRVSHCVMEKIADKPVWPCAQCQLEESGFKSYPAYCAGCGVVLQGGATVHGAGCLIEPISSQGIMRRKERKNQ